LSGSGHPVQACSAFYCVRALARSSS